MAVFRVAEGSLSSLHSRLWYRSDRRNGNSVTECREDAETRRGPDVAYVRPSPRLCVFAAFSYAGPSRLRFPPFLAHLTLPQLQGCGCVSEFWCRSFSSSLRVRSAVMKHDRALPQIL